MADISDWLRANSQSLINTVRALIAVLIGFHIVTVTPEQTALLITLMESTFATITAKTTINTTKVDTIVERRIGDIMTEPPKK